MDVSQLPDSKFLRRCSALDVMAEDSRSKMIADTQVSLLDASDRP